MYQSATHEQGKHVAYSRMKGGEVRIIHIEATGQHISGIGPWVSDRRGRLISCRDMKCLLVPVALLLELLRHLSAGLRSCLSDERRLFAVRALVLAGVALDILLGNFSVFLKKRRRTMVSFDTD